MTDPMWTFFAGGVSYASELPVGHVLDRIKTEIQTNPTGKDHVKRVLKSPYRGLTWNILPACFKVGARWTTLPLAHDLAEKIFKPSFVPASTGCLNAAITTALFCPFDRIKVHVMTGGSSTEILSSLWRGWQPHFARNCVGSMVFLTAYDVYRDAFKRRFKELKWYHLGMIGTITGFTNALIHKPFSMIKDQMQQKNWNGESQLIPAMRRIYNSYGLRSIYRGMGVSMARSGWYGGFTTVCMYQLNALPSWMGK